MHRGALAVLPLVLLAAACTHRPYGAAQPRLAHLRRGGIAFDYPAAWRYRRRGFLTPMSEGIVDLSTQPMVSPCRTHGRETVCSWPIRRLRPGGVVVTWEIYGGEMALMHRPHAGAHVRRTRDGSCRAIGGAESLQGTVLTHAGRLYYAFACLARSGLRGNAAAFAAMVRSARPG